MSDPAAVATVEAVVDLEGTLVELGTDPSFAFVGVLEGTTLLGRFRRRLHSGLPAAARVSPRLLLFDELPVTRLIAGYAR